MTPPLNFRDGYGTASREHARTKQKLQKYLLLIQKVNFCVCFKVHVRTPVEQEHVCKAMLLCYDFFQLGKAKLQ